MCKKRISLLLVAPLLHNRAFDLCYQDNLSCQTYFTSHYLSTIVQQFWDVNWMMFRCFNLYFSSCYYILFVHHLCISSKFVANMLVFAWFMAWCIILCSDARHERFWCSYFLSCSFIDLPNLSSSIYSTELCNRLRAFLLACPPSGPSPPVAELVIATADFQKDLAIWNIR